MAQQDTRVWFITGCSTGFGREIAKQVLEKGDRAVITARDPQKIHDLADGYNDRALVLKLDVTDAKQVESAVDKAHEKFGGIDVLVNNAGYGYLGAVEESEEKDVRDMFEANFFGLARMIHVVLPDMRKRRKGCIVNMSSMAGLAGLPGVGYYNATKFAVEGLSEALSKEIEPLGLKVLIVEPGPFRTDWAGRSLKQSPKEIADYAATAGVRRHGISSYSGNQPGDPVRAAAAIIKAAEDGKSPLRLVLGKIALDAARAKLDTLRKNFDACETESLSADYPKNQAA